MRVRRATVRAKYDAAQTTADNRRHWSNADGLSAAAANSPEVRRVLRNRSRYEAANSCYASGIIETLANDTIGTGPRLQLLTPNAEANQRVADAFESWCSAVGLAEKLRTFREARAVDGEAFAQIVNNDALTTKVKIDLRLIEADQVANPYQVRWDSNSVDGIEFDENGNPTKYYVLNRHPGDTGSLDELPLAAKEVRAHLMLHWFKARRPGQKRGIPEITPALELFAQLRRFTQATISAAETAADFAAMLKTPAPASGCEDEEVEADAFEEIEIVKRMMITLPGGTEMQQLKAEHPATTYDMFKREILNEIARCLNVPYNVAAGNSSSYNYSSGRLDHQVYHRAIGVDRYFLETAILTRIFAAWLYDAITEDPQAVDGLGLVRDPKRISFVVPPPHTWFWDGFAHVDPTKEATAQETRLRNGTTTLADEWAESGHDWRAKARQQAEERKFYLELGIPFPGEKLASPAQAEEPEEPTVNQAKAQGHRIAANTAQNRLQLSVDTAIELRAAEGEGKRPRFSMVAYTGAPVVVGGFYTPVIIDLEGFKSASQEIPILFGHDMDKIVGQTETVTFNKSGVGLSGLVTGDNTYASEVVSQAKNGFKWRASVGAVITRREFLESGKKATVNGREVAGPMVIAREAELLEVSFVSIGADNATSASVAASSQPLVSSNGVPDMEFDAWLKAKGFDPAALSDTQKAPLRAAFDAEQKAAAPPPAPPVQASAAPVTPPTNATLTLEAVMAERRTENDRIGKITEIADRWTSERPMQLDSIERLAKAAIEAKGTSPDHFELMLLRELRASAAPNVVAHPGKNEVGPKVIEAAVAMSAGLRNPSKYYDERTLNLADDKFKRGIGLRELLMMAAKHNGNYSGYGTSDLEGMLRAAYGHNRDIRANAGFSTLDISGILSNVGNKLLRVAFEAVESGWRDITATQSLNDFKAHTTYSLTGDLQYEKVGAGGEIPHGTLGELSYTLQADTYGKMLAITRKDLINDDLGALNRIPVRLGRGAALAINHVFWTVFMTDITTFWASGHANVSSGGGSALSSAGLKAAVQLFRKQTDPDGKPLGISPKILLVPPELEITADELMTSTTVNTGGSSSTEKVPNRNVWTSKFKPVMSSYLSNSSYTGYSTAHWFLLADPADLPTISIGFLNGREMPVIESADADFDTLGIRFRGYHDFGVAKQEYRASVRSIGS